MSRSPMAGWTRLRMEGFLVNYYEYHFLYITGIEHVEITPRSYISSALYMRPLNIIRSALTELRRRDSML